MDTYSVSVPDENLAIYSLLYGIEVGLREFLIEVLEAKCGARWWKERLPGDVLEAFRKAREYERSITWSQLVPHHPMHYIDFPDLRKVIERSDNWRDVFQTTFKRKDLLIATLSGLEPIRNKIAHNRKATSGDLSVVQAAYQEVVSAIGEARFRGLVEKCTLAEDIPGSLLHLQEEAESALLCCKGCRPLERLEVWSQVGVSWWFDEDYLGHEVTAIRRYFKILVAYGELPRPRGSGYKIEEWIRASELEKEYAEAIQELAVLLDNRREV